MALGCKNALGKTRRAEMLRGTVETCPAHTRFLATVWQASGPVWLEETPGIWRHTDVADGAAQGDTSSYPRFCRGLKRTLRRAIRRLSAEGIEVRVPSLADDMLLLCLCSGAC